jgi:hypothetical protein
MRALVLEEMEHIPRRPKPQQSELRSSYWFWRMNSLGKKAEVANDRSIVLQRCLQELEQAHPKVEFHYDRSYFKKPSKK